MDGIPHDHYEPKSGGEKWLHSRLPVVGLLYDTIMIPTPKNLGSTGAQPGEHSSPSTPSPKRQGYLFEF